MATCRWPDDGCGMEVSTLRGERFCTYHDKVRRGMIETTRAEGSQSVVPINLPPDRAEEARRAREAYFDDLLAREGVA